MLEQLQATRNFNYLVLPTDIVAQLQVFKSPTADLHFRPRDQFDVNISGLWTRFNADNINANFLAWPSRSLLSGVRRS